MRKALIALALCAPATPAMAQATRQAEAARTETAEPVRASKIILVGDSTTAVGSGWGSAFCSYRVTHALACLNLARGGRSTFSYRAEGSWDIALGEMKTPGYAHVWVLIQFGHNDQPGKPGRSTDLATEFPANLRRYVAEARAAGAIPVLVTPLTRRMWKDGALDRDLDPWADAVRAVAVEMHVPLIDLNARSAAIVEAMGPGTSLMLAEVPASPEVGAAATIDRRTIASTTGAPTAAAVPSGGYRVGRMNRPFDYTHLGDWGARLFAGVVTDELVRAVPDMRGMLLP